MEDMGAGNIKLGSNPASLLLALGPRYQGAYIRDLIKGQGGTA